MAANLDLVRSIYTLWERGDHRYWADAEIQYVTVGGPDSSGGGVPGVAESFAEWLCAWTDWKAAADNYLELDRERVLVPYGPAMRAGASASERERAETRGATLFHVRAHRVTRIVQYYERERAFADLGLAPEAGPSDPS